MSQILARGALLRARGQEVSAEELCRDCPELVGEVRLRLKDSLSERRTQLPDSDGDITLPARTAPDQPASVSLRPGQALGEYDLLEPLGAGGMGQVFKALHRRMDRIVAIKVLPASAVSSDAAVQRFRREVRLAARLTHPNIVTAYDAGEQAGTHYLVMEWVQGPDLARCVRREGPLSVRQAVDAITQAARGLEYAHRHGVVHRDIKPANLLLDADGTVKILDMGLARLRSGGDDHGLTRAGALMGTVDFMAPEQAERAAQADERADIYSLGCTLYYLLTGRPLYPEGELIQKIMAHREQPIPALQAARPDVPSELEAIYRRMVAKDPRQRFQSLTEVIAALGSLETLSGGSVLRPFPVQAATEGARNRRLVLAAGLAAAVLFVGLIGWLSLRVERLQSERTTIEAAHSERSVEAPLPPPAPPAVPPAPSSPLTLPPLAPPVTQAPRAAGAHRHSVGGVPEPGMTPVEEVFNHPEAFQGRVVTLDRLMLFNDIGAADGPRGTCKLVVHTEKGLPLAGTDENKMGFAFYVLKPVVPKLRAELNGGDQHLVMIRCRIERWHTAKRPLFWRAHVLQIFFYGPSGKIEKVVDAQAEAAAHPSNAASTPPAGR